MIVTLVSSQKSLPPNISTASVQGGHPYHNLDENKLSFQVEMHTQLFGAGGTRVWHYGGGAMPTSHKIIKPAHPPLAIEIQNEHPKDPVNGSRSDLYFFLI